MVWNDKRGEIMYAAACMEIPRERQNIASYQQPFGRKIDPPKGFTSQPRYQLCQTITAFMIIAESDLFLNDPIASKVRERLLQPAPHMLTLRQ